MVSINGHYSWDRMWPILVEVFTNIQSDGLQQRRGIRFAYIEVLPMIVGDIVVTINQP
jgi:hypothetical protein